MGIEKVDKEEIKWAVLALAEPLHIMTKANLEESLKETKIEVRKFIDHMHRFFYDQLRIEAKVRQTVPSFLTSSF